MRIVMPLCDFEFDSPKKGDEEFVFDGAKYAVRKFDAAEEVPRIDLFSKQDVERMEMESWALVAEGDDLGQYEEETNIMLLSFRMCKLARAFIKYHLCKEDVFRCTRLSDAMRPVLPRESSRIITRDDLNRIDEGFSRLSEMITISNRTRNAIYFMYRGLCSGKMIDSFMFLMCAVESLFSDEKRHGATKTICLRVSRFLGCKPGCTYKDIEELYDLRSKIVHGKVVVEDEIKGRLETLYKLQYVLVDCMTKMLDRGLYEIYSNVQGKEAYFAKMTQQGLPKG